MKTRYKEINERQRRKHNKYLAFNVSSQIEMDDERAAGKIIKRDCLEINPLL